MGEFMGLIVLETLRWPLPAEWAVYGAVLGTLLGAAQWIVLHHSVPRAGWWVLASAAGLAVAWAASTASGDIIYEAAIEAAGWDSVIDREHMLDVAAGLIYSLITAPLLAWLLRQRRAAPQ